MLNSYKYSILALTVLFLTSCETEIDVNAEYKDVAIVYGLLNPNDSVHYIKVTKAFSGSGNANDMAANAESFNYPAGELDVKIDEYNSSDVFVKSFTLSRTVNEVPKDNGIFSSNTNVLYKFVEPNLKKDYIYKLNIHNTKLDKDITSETNLVNAPTLASQNELNKVKLFTATGQSLTHAFSIKPNKNSGRVKVNFVFSYTEHYTDTTITPVTKEIKISLGEQKTTSNEGGDILQFTLEGSNFLSAIQNEITANVPNLQRRRINNCTIEIIVAGIDLSTYIAVNEPSTSVNQNKPEFTNLTNALGVFSSRIKTYYSSPIATNPNGFNLDGSVNYHDDTLRKLLEMGLDFCNPRNNSVGLPFPPLQVRCEDVISNWSTFNP
ncbi:MAG: hypothetical protein IT232_00770 [Flavobacteriales bacterium]|nr:hypothetical protein [Flavobacteriales bacterium]